MSEYNPGDVGVPNGNYFAMPFTPEESDVVLISVPWDVTTSYAPGTAKGPDAIIDASSHLDFYDFDYPAGYKRGIGTAETDYTILDTSKRLREEAEKVIIHLESGGSAEEEYARKKLRRINDASAHLNDYIYGETNKWRRKGKLTGLVGGEHSVPFGHIRAVAEEEGPIGLLHIDAHADLRRTYEGFEHSHASIMYNVMASLPQVTGLVQVGVRDLCEEEIERIESDGRIVCFSDRSLYRQRFAGITWAEQCDTIIENLPDKVYVSFDIDGLTPENCPNTGTPVPGGLSFNEAMFLLSRVVEKGKRIVGFDLCEVAPGQHGEWDANVGARVLYKLCNLTLLSNPKR